MTNPKPELGANVLRACVTVLKAYFETYDFKNHQGVPLDTLLEKPTPYDPIPFKAYIMGLDHAGNGTRTAIPSDGLTIEGELNKLAMNVAMAHTIGGVHWRSDNPRSISLGEALAAQILADITVDVTEDPVFRFRTFSRKPNGQPKMVEIAKGQIRVDGTVVPSHPSAL